MSRIGLLLVCFAPLEDTSRPWTDPARRAPDVAVEIRYRMPDAGVVIMEWGIDGWTIPPALWRPPRTIAQPTVLYTPMRRVGDVFVLPFRVPAGTTIDFNLRMTKSRDGVAVDIWDTAGGRGFHVKGVRDTAITLDPSPEIPQLFAMDRSANLGFQWRGLWRLVVGFGLVAAIAWAVGRVAPRIRDRGWLSRDVAGLIVFAIATRLALAAIGYLSVATEDIGSRLVAPLRLSYVAQELTAFEYADPSWYRAIAEEGYERRAFSAREHANWAFYPLWPLVLRASGWVWPDLVVTGVLLSNLFLLGAIVVGYRLFRMDFDRQVATSALVLVTVFPAGYFLSRGGPESLFLLLTLGSFYLARQSRWAAAGLMAALGTLTRLQGILIMAPLLYLFWGQWRQRSVRLTSVWYLSLPLVAMAGFCGYLYHLTGNALASFGNQAAWGNKLSLPFAGMIDFLSQLNLIHYWGWDLSPVSFLFVFAATCLTAVMLWRRRIPAEYAIYAVLCLALVLARNNLQGSLRYMLPVFPLFLMLALALQERRYGYTLTVFVFGALQAFYFAAFVLRRSWAAT